MSLQSPTPSNGFPGASLSDLLSVARNIVQAINGAAQTYLSVQGAQDMTGIAATTLVKTGQGRVCSVSVTTAGSATGTIYDYASVTSPANPLYVIPMAVGVYVVNLPVGLGVVVTPGTGQTLALSFS